MFCAKRTEEQPKQEIRRNKADANKSIEWIRFDVRVNIVNRDTQIGVGAH